MTIVKVAAGTQLSLHLDGNCDNAIISPNGKSVAATYLGGSDPNTVLLLWDTKARNKPAWRTVRFPHDVSKVSWLGNDRLIVSTLSVYGRKSPLRESFLVSRSGRIIGPLSNKTSNNLAGEVSPYSDASGRLLVLQGLTRASYALKNVDPMTGKAKTI